jgi:translation initiation factor IF-2
LVFAFHAMTNPQVEKLATQYGVEIRKYSVIYKLLEDVRAIMTGMLDPETIEIVLGQAKIKAVFFTKRNEKIIGCGIESGKIENKTHARVIRAGEVVGEGRIDSLKKVDKVVSELGAGNDCGIKFIGNFDLEEGDIIESFKFETRARQLESN